MIKVFFELKIILSFLCINVCLFFPFFFLFKGMVINYILMPHRRAELIGLALFIIVLFLFFQALIYCRTAIPHLNQDIIYRLNSNKVNQACYIHSTYAYRLLQNLSQGLTCIRSLNRNMNKNINSF